MYVSRHGVQLFACTDQFEVGLLPIEMGMQSIDKNTEAELAMQTAGLPA